MARTSTSIPALCLAAGLTLLGPASHAPADGSPDRRAQSVPSAGEIDSADALLNALEQADADLESLAADIQYTRTFAIAGDRQIRTGRLYFTTKERADDSPDRRFAVHFERLRVGVRVRDEEKAYIFDGEWFVERMPEERLFIKRQVVPPGESFDPLRIGEGPFPIPIGQKREDILERFEAELLDTDDGLDNEALRRFARGSHQLRLIPRSADVADDLKEVRIWYKQGSLLPQMAFTRTRDGDESIVQLLNVRTNEHIDTALLDTTAPRSGWDVEIVPWRDRSAAGER